MYTSPPRVERFLRDVRTLADEDEETNVGLLVRARRWMELGEFKAVVVHLSTFYSTVDMECEEDWKAC